MLASATPIQGRKCNFFRGVFFKGTEFSPRQTDFCEIDIVGAAIAFPLKFAHRTPRIARKQDKVCIYGEKVNVVGGS